MKKNKSEAKKTNTNKQFLFNSDKKLITAKTTAEEANKIYIDNPKLGNWKLRPEVFEHL